MTAIYPPTNPIAKPRCETQSNWESLMLLVKYLFTGVGVQNSSPSKLGDGQDGLKNNLRVSSIIIAVNRRVHKLEQMYRSGRYRINHAVPT
ncbi:hypothetical protein [Calothrix sp. NIES-3974]|uniref:hypothetical protein n=1 Tax=Calothrix sp. NIES-3974 TaxID=2005462 RepID=UPI000B61F1F5|nr:hypothetical protein [Calothrix sp. NIES-3974]BAZ05399.1 hypothetical protein NIES3974_20470 [Calothrix sp. NIES-3974]